MPSIVFKDLAVLNYDEFAWARPSEDGGTIIAARDGERFKSSAPFEQFVRLAEEAGL